MFNELLSNAVENLFSERKDFIIIGLTGRTGSGCSTLAKLLTKSFEELQPPKQINGSDIEKRQYEIVYNYACMNWKSFRLIEMKNIIFTFILENTLKEFTDFVVEEFNENINADTIIEEYEYMNKKD